MPRASGATRAEQTKHSKQAKGRRRKPAKEAQAEDEQRVVLPTEDTTRSTPADEQRVVLPTEDTTRSTPASPGKVDVSGVSWKSETWDSEEPIIELAGPAPLGGGASPWLARVIVFGVCCGLVVSVVVLSCLVVVLFIPPPSRLKLPVDRTTCMIPPEVAAPWELPSRAPSIDVVVYGATGFLGELTVRYLASRPGSFTLAIAGRSSERLMDVSKILLKVGERPVDKVFVVEADDLVGLRAMVKEARVVVSTVGPFAAHGSKLLQVCAEEGAHYVDSSQDAWWQRSMVDAFHATAIRTGAKVVLAAGYDSVPFDIGAALAYESFSPHQVSEQFVIIAAVQSVRGWFSKGMSPPSVSLANSSSARAALDPYYLMPGTRCPVDRDVSGWGSIPRFEDSMGGIAIPHQMAQDNALIVRRSMGLLGWHGVAFMEGMMISALLDNFWFLIPYMLSGEVVLGKEGLAPSVQSAGGHQILVDAHDKKTGLKVKVYIEGRGDPSYAHSSKVLSEIALCLLDAICHRPGIGGGLLTPASALAPRQVAARLNAAKHEDGKPLLSFRFAGRTQPVRHSRLETVEL